MTDKTVHETIHGAAMVLAMIADCRKHGCLDNIPAATVKEVQRIEKQLERRIDKLINPKPRKPRKPKADVSGADSVVVEYLDGGTKRTEGYVNSNERWGRDGRNG